MHFLTPSLLSGNREVEQALFDPIPPIIDSASQIGQPLLMRVLNLPAPAQEGWGQKVHAQPPRLRGSLIHGGWEVEQGWFLVGNN